MDARWMQETPTEPFFTMVARKDARRAPRRTWRGPCEIITADDDAPSLMRAGDVSLEGVWLDTLLPLPVGEKVVVAFRPPEWSNDLTLFARVERSTTGRLRRDRGPVGMGLSFLDLTPDQRSRLADALHLWPMAA
jgi:hypothetical protein